MAVKINLEKDAYIKKGAVGYSYTTYFWEFFVPIFRGDGKGFFMLLAISILISAPIYLINYFLKNFIFDPNSLFNSILMPLLNIKYKYILISYTLFSELLSMISIVVWLYVGNWYNKNYTMRLLNKGYFPNENDSYALALLKGYGCLEYTEDEKTKYYIFLIYFIILFVITIITNYSAIIKIGDVTYLEFLQK